MSFMVNICFPSWSLELQYLLSRRCLGDQPPIQVMNSNSLIGSPGQKYCTHISTHLILKKIHLVCSFSLWKGKSIRKHVHRFLQNLLVYFSLDDSVIEHFTVRETLSHESLCVLSSMSASKDSPNECGLEELQSSAGMGFTRTTPTH